MEYSPKSDYLSIKSSQNSLKISQSFPNQKTYNCEIHKEKNLNIVCTYPSCQNQGFICLLCQYEKHLDHSTYCLPWEIFLDNIEKNRFNNKKKLEDLRNKLKTTNNAAKRIIKKFAGKVYELCKTLSNEIDQSVDQEIHLMEEILKKDKQLCLDVKHLDEDRETYQNLLRNHLKNVLVEISSERVEKISLICREDQVLINKLQKLLLQTQNFELYLHELMESNEAKPNEISGISEKINAANSTRSVSNLNLEQEANGIKAKSLVLFNEKYY